MNKSLALFGAIKKGDMSRIELLIANGVDVNVEDPVGFTPLCSAIFKKEKPIAELLLANGANVNCKDFTAFRCRTTILHVLAKSNKLEMAEFLIDKGIDVNAVDEYKRTPLHLATSHIDMVQLLITRGADLNVLDNKGCTPLFCAVNGDHKEVSEILMSNGAKVRIEMAVVRGDIEKVREFIDKGENINAVRIDGKSLLNLAVRRNDKAMVVFLLEKGANVNFIANIVAQTPLDIALENKYKDIENLLLKYGGMIWEELVTDICYAAGSGDKERVQHIIAICPGINDAIHTYRLSYNLQETPLGEAAKNRRLSIAELLISKGAYVNDQDSQGKAPLHYAAIKGHIDMVELLLTNGADIEAKTTQPILTNGADIEAKITQPMGRTALHLAASWKHKGVVRLLVAKGAEINTKDTDTNSGRTALHYAVESNSKEIAEFLIVNGADINAKARKPKGGYTPLTIAAFWGNKEMVELLLTSGADINIEDAHGLTALDRAREEEHEEVAELLLQHAQKQAVEVLPDVDKMKTVWPKLPEHIKRAIIEQIKASTNEDEK